MRFYRQSIDNSEPSNVFNYNCSNPLPVALRVVSNGLATALCFSFFHVGPESRLSRPCESSCKLQS